MATRLPTMIAAGIAGGAGLISVAGCSGDFELAPDEPDTTPASVTISPRDVSVAEGDSVQLSLTVRNAADEVIEPEESGWASLNVEAAIVTGDGLVRGTGLGEAPIVATVGELTDTITVSAHVEFTAVAAGAQHSCAITRQGTAFCWGEGSRGRLGTGEMRDTDVPRRVALQDHRFRKIAAGFEFTCGVAVGGGVSEALCWGSNRSGQLGIGGKTDAPTPEPVAGQPGLSLVATSVRHACGVNSEARAFCWGADFAGQLGDGSGEWEPRPLQVESSVLFVAVDAGEAFSCGVDESGTAHCWGDNRFGQLGRDDLTLECLDQAGDSWPCSRVPVPVATGLRFTSVATGGIHACGLSDGSIYCWGDNSRGQLGDGTADPSSSPVAVLSELRFLSLAAGEWHTCAVAESGDAYCWGDNRDGNLGNNSGAEVCDGSLCSTQPRLVMGGHLFRSISAARSTIGGHTCGITRDSTALCWGKNDRGQLGAGFSGGISFTPLEVVGQQ